MSALQYYLRSGLLYSFSETTCMESLMPFCKTDIENCISHPAKIDTYNIIFFYAYATSTHLSGSAQMINVLYFITHTWYCEWIRCAVIFLFLYIHIYLYCWSSASNMMHATVEGACHKLICGCIIKFCVYSATTTGLWNWAHSSH